MKSEGQSSQPACCPARNGQFKWGRIIALAGAVGLCVSFFMPQIGFIVTSFGAGAGAGVVVAVAPVDTLNLGVTNLVSSCLPFLAAVLLLPLLASRVVPRVDAAKVAGKCLAWSQCAICLSVLIIGLGGITYFLVPVALGSMGVDPLGYAMPPVGVGALLLAVVALVRSPLLRKAAAAQFALWAYYLADFIYAATMQEVLHAGMWLSIAASGALVIGSAIDWFQCWRIPE
jgi:hypothetical protein